MANEFQISQQKIEQTARASYGKLVAILTKASGGDIALAEDCLAQAFAKALELWPQQGVPQNPEAWLVTTAKNSARDSFRHHKVQRDSESDLIDYLSDQQIPMTSDYRLELLLICSHPAIDPSIRIPLMLQAVMGFTVQEISALFLLSPATLEKRLTRAKQKIKLAQIPFSRPEVCEMPDRIRDVLETIYGVFGKSWDSWNDSLEEEALFLSRLLVDLLPQESEPKGLLSLVLFCKSRKSARRKEGCYIPLFEQDRQLWDQSLIQQAEGLLKEAFLLKSPGRFQYEAALQSALIAKLIHGVDTDADVVKLYQALLEESPSVGLIVSFGSALLRMNKIPELHTLLEGLDLDRVKAYQPYWVLQAKRGLALKDFDAAKKHFETALGLTEDLAVKNYLIKKLQNLSSEN